MSLFFQVLYDNTRFVEKEEEKKKKKKKMMMMMMMTGGKNANRINDGTMVKTLLSLYPFRPAVYSFLHYTTTTTTSVSCFLLFSCVERRKKAKRNNRARECEFTLISNKCTQSSL
jgi:hypothetical protein